MWISQFASANFPTVVWLLNALAQFDGWSAGIPSYFSKRGKPKAPRDLSQHDCITSTFGGSLPHKFGCSRQAKRRLRSPCIRGSSRTLSQLSPQPLQD